METWLINRADRQDRLYDVRRELDNQGINAHLFSAIIDSCGWAGCRDSHLAIMEKCKKHQTFAIYEDDVHFLLDREATIRILTDAMDELPSNWDCLYLGASPQKPQIKYSNNLYLLTDAKTTHAIIWHNRELGAVNYILRHKQFIRKWDRYLYEIIQPLFNCFVTYPMLCTQRQTKSDIAKRSDCSTILKNYNKFCL